MAEHEGGEMPDYAVGSISGDPNADERDGPDYRKAFQDEYQRLWHRTVIEREALKDLIAHVVDDLELDLFSHSTGVLSDDAFISKVIILKDELKRAAHAE